MGFSTTCTSRPLRGRRPACYETATGPSPPSSLPPDEPNPTLPTYTNPVCADSLGDPFVLKHNGRFYLYATHAEGRPGIPVLRSDDLVTWERLGVALDGPPGAAACWAPEVAYDEGTFYLYYSAGGLEGEGHGLRVAASSRPEGPFEDVGPLYPGEGFTIDPHPFRDVDGRWYLFHCRDFLEGERIG